MKFDSHLTKKLQKINAVGLYSNGVSLEAIAHKGDTTPYLVTRYLRSEGISVRSSSDAAKMKYGTLGKKKLVIYLPEGVFYDLAELSRNSKKPLAELIKTSFGLLKIATDETAKGNELVVLKNGKPIKRILI
jgi:hypothetical protein